MGSACEKISFSQLNLAITIELLAKLITRITSSASAADWNLLILASSRFSCVISHLN